MPISSVQWPLLLFRKPLTAMEEPLMYPWDAANFLAKRNYLEFLKLELSVSLRSHYSYTLSILGKTKRL